MGAHRAELSTASSGGVCGGRPDAKPSYGAQLSPAQLGAERAGGVYLGGVVVQLGTSVEPAPHDPEFDHVHMASVVLGFEATQWVTPASEFMHTMLSVRSKPQKPQGEPADVHWYS